MSFQTNHNKFIKEECSSLMENKPIDWNVQTFIKTVGTADMAFN